MRWTDEDYFDHPILFKRNIFEKAWGRAWRKIVSHQRDRPNMKKKANRKARRAIKQALKGNSIRIKKMPGDSWSVW